MSDGGYRWRDGERAAYERAVRARLDDPRLRELLERRPTVTDNSVVAAMCEPQMVRRILGERPGRLSHHAHLWAGRLNQPYRWAAPESQSLAILMRPDGEPSGWSCGSGCAALVTLAVLGAAGVPFLLSIPISFLPVVAFAAFVQARRAVLRSLPALDPPPVWQAVFVAAPLIPLIFVLWLLEQATAALWIRDLRRGKLPGEVDLVVEEQLGEDRGTLLVTSGYEGLRSPRLRSYFVTNDFASELNRKMDQLDGGVIALSGPRGVGKTTLLETSVRPEDFAVFAHAPATYAPHDFLTSLFVSVCQSYIVRAGFDAPEFVRLSYMRRVARAVYRPFRRAAPRLAFALPALTLLGAGLYATQRALERNHWPGARRYLTHLWDRSCSLVTDVLDGRAPQAALALTVAGIALWVLRDSRSFVVWLRSVVNTVVTLTVLALVLLPFLSLFVDPDINAHMGGLWTPWAVTMFVAYCACVALMVGTDDNDFVILLGRIVNRSRFELPAKLLPLAFLLLALVDDDTRPLFTDSGHPARIGCVLLGILLNKVRSGPWSFLRPAPKLVVDCRDHLYRLQTVQSSSAGLSTSPAAQLLTLGTSHSTSLTSVPPNYPALVSEFRDLLTRIAADEHRQKHRVVIAVDELDRLGSDTQALAFLSEIKAILGVPHVHYLVSVAEDVGAAFVRRGLPHRDVTDSSLDDVLHVRPCGVEEARRILAVRAPGIGDPYVLLAHALSGGIPRDLIRYGRRLLEIRSATSQVELPDVAVLLIVEELSETLAGFRTLLAKQQWSADDPDVLGMLRSLGTRLRTACPCPGPMRELRLALARFAVAESDGLPAESRLLLDEAAVYGYFSFTLLDVFGRPDFNRRRIAAALGSADSAAGLLAGAREELSLSPYSARPLIDEVRRAWGLEPVTTATADAAAVVPGPPRYPACYRHPFTTLPWE